MKIVFIGDIVGKEARQKFIESIPDIKINLSQTY